jgi:hypothetical protein
VISQRRAGYFLSTRRCAERGVHPMVDRRRRRRITDAQNLRGVDLIIRELF